jgi:hypothetical protein
MIGFEVLFSFCGFLLVKFRKRSIVLKCPPNTMEHLLTFHAVWRR